MTCPHCAKSIRTDNGMTFHASWCKAPAPKAAPIVQPATIRPKARKAARRARGPEARRQRQAASLAAYSKAARLGEHLPVCYADAGCLCSLRNRPTAAPTQIAYAQGLGPRDWSASYCSQAPMAGPLTSELADPADPAAPVLDAPTATPGAGTEHLGVRKESAGVWVAFDRETTSQIGPTFATRYEAQAYAEHRQRTTYGPAPVLDALTLCNGCDIRPMADNAAGYCAECLAAANAPEPTTPAAMPAPKARKARAPKSGKVGGLTYADGVVLLAGGLVRVSREAGDYSAAVLAREAAIARGKSRTQAPSIGIDKLRPSPAEGFELGPWKAWGDPAPKAAPVARRSARRPVGPGSCWCPRDHKAPATVAATLDPNRYATRFFPKTSTYAKAA